MYQLLLLGIRGERSRAAVQNACVGNMSMNIYEMEALDISRLHDVWLLH